MTVVELIAWLTTQDQDKMVEVVVFTYTNEVRRQEKQASWRTLDTAEHASVGNVIRIGVIDP